jgi:PAS domain S-box-containing protein
VVEAGKDGLLDVIPDVILLVDASGMVCRAEGGAAGRYGWRPEDVVGRSVLDRIHPDDREHAARTFARLMATPGSPPPVELRIRRGDGTFATVAIATHNRLDDPTLAGIVMVLRDVSERPGSAGAAPEEATDYRRIVELSGVGLWTVDRESRTSYVNPRVAELLGYPPAAMVGRPLLDFMDEEGRALYRSNLEQRRPGVVDQQDFKFVRADGRPVWAIVATEPLTAADDTYAGNVLVVTDISTRRATEHSLRMSEQRFRLASEHAPIGLAIVGLDGRWLQVNRALCEIVDRTPDELMQLTFQDITHPDDLDSDLELVERVLAGQQRSYEMDKRYVRPDGTVVQVRLIVALVRDDDAEPLYFISQILDVTARKQQEAALERQRVELARSNAELEHFAYVASHDLREPLRAINGFARLLDVDYTRALDEQGREYLQYLVGATERLQRMIDDLLAYSQVGTEPARTPVDLGAVAADVLGGLEPSIGETGASVEVGPMPEVVANRSQVEMLVQNLVANALKFHRPDRPPRVVLSAAVDGEECRLVVDDDGIGIPAPSRERVFKMFQRLHTQEQFPGTGIGLAMCRRIASANGGDITLDDSPLGGARVVVTLPAAPR